MLTLSVTTRIFFCTQPVDMRRSFDGLQGLVSQFFNVAERDFRVVALGRRNWLFLGSDEGGETAALMYSVVTSCQQVGVEPFDYLRDVLTELPKLGRKPTQEQLQRWLPDEWKKRKAAMRGPLGQEPAENKAGAGQAQTPSV